jgi:CRP-like cAMP-binding protein
MAKDFSRFQEFVSNYVSLNKTEWFFLKNILKCKKYKKKEIIHNLGDVSDQIMYVNSGLIRSYMINSDGKEFTWSIHFNDKTHKAGHLFAVDYSSFLNNTSSNIELEVLEDCEVFCLTNKELNILYSFSSKYEKMARLMLEDGFTYLQDMYITLTSEDAYRRYEFFKSNYGYFEDKIPQYQVASYLRLTPQHFVKIKKEFEEKSLVE